MRWSIIVGVGCLAVGCVASPSFARSASLSVRLVPASPAPGSTATLTISGSTEQTAIPLVVASTGEGCPPRIPNAAHVLVPDGGVVTGGIGRSLRVRIAPATTRFCVFLVPATEDADGKPTYAATAPPLDAAEVRVAGTPRLIGGGVILGTTRADTSSVALTIARSGTRITRITVTCGGNALRPPAIGRLFIGKRFDAKVSLPLAKKIHWSGRLLPDNSSNYDVPPAPWHGIVRYTLDAQLVVDPLDGTPQLITGRGTLSGPRLPCPKQRRYARL